MKNTQITKVCIVCGSTYKVKKYRANSKYCSRQCWAHRSPPRVKHCEKCFTEFSTYDDNQRFCSQSCAGKSRVGKNANAYKNGNAAQTKRGKLKGQLAKWRKKVYKRDKYTCQKCGNIGIELHAHHVKELAKFPDLVLDVNNGVTVCVPCHEKIHGRKISTPSKYPKKCIDCGTDIPGNKSNRCVSCGISNSWKNSGRMVPEKICPVCKTKFRKRRDQIFCSRHCARKHCHSLSKTG